MSQKYQVIFLFSVAGFMVGVLILHFLEISEWSTIPRIVTLSTGSGYLLGHFLSKKV